MLVTKLSLLGSSIGIVGSLPQYLIASMTFCTMQNYYPWNTTALINWLKQEPYYHEKQSLETILKIPRHSIRIWLTDPTPTITMAQIRAIAQYRGWNLNQMIEWLELQPSHVKELLDQDIAEAS